MVAPLTPIYHRKVGEQSARLFWRWQGDFLAISQDHKFAKHLDLQWPLHARRPIACSQSTAHAAPCESTWSVVVRCGSNRDWLPDWEWRQGLDQSESGPALSSVVLARNGGHALEVGFTAFFRFAPPWNHATRL